MNIYKIIVDSYKSDSNLMTLIGLLLFSFLVAFYLYHNPETKNENNIEIICGTLLEKPIYEDMGENPDYMSIYIVGHERKFVLTGCGLDIVNKKILLNMNTGDSIIVSVDKDEFSGEGDFLNDNINVLEIELPKNRPLLTVSMINDCERNSWKNILWFSPFIGIAIIVSLFNLIRKAYKESTTK